jgi:6,7-dimethyl-8-ribityllumazine synthase
MKTYEGELQAKGLKFAVVVSRFNDFITNKLLSGKVPGAFELPLAAKKVAEKKSYDAVICLGTIIRGATPHFDYVAAEASKGIATASMDSGIPIAFGVVTSDTIEQAVERAGSKSGNKGWDAAMVAIEMAQLLKKL